MTEDNYEILPHQLLQDLKADVEMLQKKLSQPDRKANELILEIESLKDSIHEITVVFQKALEETKEEDITKVVKLVNERMEAVVSQNETIAKGMIAISDKLEDFMSHSPKPAAHPGSAMPQGPPSMQHTMGPPPSMGGPRMAPPPAMPGANELPPPPPGPGKRKGLFR